MALMSASFGGDVVDGLYKKYMPTEMTSSNNMPTTINLTNPLVFMLCASNRHLLPLQVQGFSATVPGDGKDQSIFKLRLGEKDVRVMNHPWIERSVRSVSFHNHSMHSGELILYIRELARSAGPPYFKLIEGACAKIFV